MQRPKQWGTPVTSENQLPDSEEKSHRYVFFWSFIYIIAMIFLFIGVVTFVTGL
ncbi:MAG: hypothetical protein KDJ65_25375 [Anaerolineae bacterium]|nr:hypothetical protein [Anaerolineae bacterium]